MWAVGYEFDSVTGHRATLLEHFDGDVLVRRVRSQPGRLEQQPARGQRRECERCLGRRLHERRLGYNSLIEHWDGSAWSVVPPADDPGSVEDVLAGVSEDGTNDVWAFGYHVVGSRYKTLAEHWDGSSWTVVPSANGGTTS